MHYWLIFANLIFFSSAHAVPVGKLVDRIVAIVNDKTILNSDLEVAVKKLKDVVKTPTQDAEQKALDQLINKILVDQEIEHRGLTANDGVVDSAIAQVMKQNGMSSMDQLIQALKAEHITLEEYRVSLKNQIETSRLINDAIRSKIQISDQDVMAEYRRNLKETEPTNLMRVKMIFKKKSIGKGDQKAIKQVERELNIGIPYERLANRETEGPGKGDGGNIGLVNPNEMQPELKAVLLTLKPGETSKPIFTPQGSYLLKCVEITKGKPQDNLSEMQKNEIREKLTQLETEQAFDRLVRDLRGKAHIQVML